MPAMAPQPTAAAPMAASPVKPVGGDLDSTMASLAGSKFQYGITPQALVLKMKYLSSRSIVLQTVTNSVPGDLFS